MQGLDKSKKISYKIYTNIKTKMVENERIKLLRLGLTLSKEEHYG